jgi:hypothetical protein
MSPRTARQSKRRSRRSTAPHRPKMPQGRYRSWVDIAPDCRPGFNAARFFASPQPGGAARVNTTTSSPEVVLMSWCKLTTLTPVISCGKAIREAGSE